MTQVDGEATKYKLNNQYNYNHYGQMRKAENNQQEMPLYENCTLTNNKQEVDHMLLERSRSTSDTFNCEYRLVSNTTNAADINGEVQVRRTDSFIADYDYENIHFGGKHNLDKKILLQKYFRSALVGPRSNVYENLCRGCNYGVFNARGPLCAFCECIVNGVSSLRSDTPETSVTTSNNIYENICEHCGIIYNGLSCTECKYKQIQEIKKVENFIENDIALEVGSDEFLLEENVTQNKKSKLSKSKSFNKSHKPKIFTNFWDTIRKPKFNANNAVNKKPLEIIHHVDGYEQVFHTKDTFDLKKICELKRSGTSCSDQHIYGRLKKNDFNLSDQEFNSTQSLTQSTKSLTVSAGKKPRISKPKFLRTPPSVTSIDSAVKVEYNTTNLYLNNSVCHWLTSLRHNIHAYNTINEHDQETFCYPKSIPSKNALISCKAPLVTNHTNRIRNLTPNNNADVVELFQMPTSHNCMASTDSWDIQEIEGNQQQPDCYQWMVEEFIASIINKQMLRGNECKPAMAGTNAKGNCPNNYTHNNKNNRIDNEIEIPLRQAIMTANNTYFNNKHKRQGIYLRLEDHQGLPHINGYQQMNLHCTNAESNNNRSVNKEKSITEGDRREKSFESITGCEHLISLRNPRIEYNTVTTPDTLLACEMENTESISYYLNPLEAGPDLIKPDNRRGVHERNILEDFEKFLEQEKINQLVCVADTPLHLKRQTVEKFQKCEQDIAANSLQLQLFAAKPQSISLHIPILIPDLIQLTNQQHLSSSLNTLVICYNKYLKVFLTNANKCANAHKIPNKQLVRKFKRFYYNCELSNERRLKPKTTVRDLAICVSSKLKLDLNVTSCFEHAHVRLNESESLNTISELKQANYCGSDLKKIVNQKIKTPPQVPKRDPKTKLSPTATMKESFDTSMTKPGINLSTESKSENTKEEESIYQPIWKFETKGKVRERYRTDDDYYDLKALKQKLQQESPNSDIPKILISSENLPTEEEDYNNWETDEEFVFTKQIKKQRSSSLTSERLNTNIRSSHGSNSSIGTSSSLSGSTITEFASSTATLASTFSCSIKHSLFRNIGIFYSLTEPKLRAIIYDYDRIHSFRYFGKPGVHCKNVNDSGIGKSLTPEKYKNLKHAKVSPSANSSPSTSAKSSPVSTTKWINPAPYTHKYTPLVSANDKCSAAKAQAPTCKSSTTPSLIPKSVQAWKYQLLDVNYIEDEEDMIVSECAILRSQQIRDDIDQSASSQPQQFMQRFKSRSTENFLDIPIEDDKKTIAERLANMYTRFSPIQRGILNINSRNSPKSEKKAYKLNRASQSTSLYLEDGLKPKYPVFGAALDQLELQQHVPRFVVDAVDYIERKDRIVQDGIYRACGNKFSIDELKQKLTKSYIYDSKLITADDIHTVTSLLKQFFRDLPEPVIPQAIYSRITTHLADKQSFDIIRIAIEEMKEPNKSTLRFLIKHLTNVAACSSSNRMNASNVAIVWGPSLFAQNDTYDMIGRMNTLTKVLIENYDRIFNTNERLL